MCFSLKQFFSVSRSLPSTTRPPYYLSSHVKNLNLFNEKYNFRCYELVSLQHNSIPGGGGGWSVTVLQDNGSKLCRILPKFHCFIGVEEVCSKEWYNVKTRRPGKKICSS